MKKEMVKQNKLFTKSFKGSHLPILDLKVDIPYMSSNTHDTILINKGKGAAFNINVTRIPHDETTQRVAATGIHTSVTAFSKSINILNQNESIEIHRDISDTVKNFTIQIRFNDVFMENHEMEYFGHFNNVKLKHFRGIVIE